MTLHATTVLSNTTATRLTPLGQHSGMDFTIQNVDTSAYVYVGAEGVTSTSYGFRVSPGSALSFELPGNDSLYAISNVNGSLIAVLQISLESGF